MANAEILTIQLGEFSNFIGAHWWNLQDATSVAGKYDTSDGNIDHSVFFRRGSSDTNGTAWTPRLIAVDLKGYLDFPSEKEEFPVSFHSDLHWKTKQEGGCGDRSNSTTSETCSLETDCQWRNLLNNRLHPNSLNLLPGYQHKNPVDMFTIFPLGVKCMEKEENLETIENQVRFFVEECDYFQGFNLLLDANNGFGGIASKILQLMKEEYPNKTIYAIPSLPAHTGINQNSSYRAECLTNIGFVMESLFDESCMLSPVSLDPLWCSNNTRKFNHLQFKPDLFYHTSALIATALDTVTFPLRSGPTLSLTNFVRNLTVYERKAVGISCSIPLAGKVFNFESLNSVITESVPLTPGVNMFRDSWAQNLVWRGVSNVSDFQSVVDSWSRWKWEQSATTNSVFRSSCSVAKPYPDFFLDSKSLVEQEASLDGVNFPTFGGIHNSASLGDSLNKLHVEISKIGIKRLQNFLSSGVEEDELLENRDRILSYAERYDEM